MANSRPSQTPSAFDSLLGKTLLIALIIIPVMASFSSRSSFSVHSTEITRRRGIVIRDEITASEYCLPLDLDNIHPAKKGEYRLRASGRVVTDPDYTTVWNRRAHAPKET